jgi:RhtB (resistance to homoserine/threonine) family protein
MALFGSILVVHLLALISPGPNFLIVTQTAISATRRAGIITAVGIATGAAVWSSAALLGLSVVFTHLSWLYSGLKIVGGFYLLYFGMQLWRAAGRPIVVFTRQGEATDGDWRLFRLGLLTNLTNPKSALFFGSVFAALLPPDVPLWAQLAAIGIIVVDALSWHIALAVLFSTRHTQQVYQRWKRWIDRTVGAALAILGVRLVLPSR